MSEIARLLRQIEEEYEAAQRGLSGLSLGGARHDFIQQKYTAIGEIATEQLAPLVGEEEAWNLVCETIDNTPSQNKKGK